MIKYKGITSDLLTDLSLALRGSVDLKHSEQTLQQFFQWLLQDLRTEKKVQLICSLPSHLKPFCSGGNDTKSSAVTVFAKPSSDPAFRSVLIVLQKYSSSDTFCQLCSCLPDPMHINTLCIHSKLFLVA